MKITRIQVDTSVIGGCCDFEFKEWSVGLLSDFRRGVFSLVLSSLTDAEIKDTPDEVKKMYKKFRVCEHEFLDLDAESIELAETYIDRGILSLNYMNDARHIAMATVANCGYFSKLELPSYCTF